MAVFMTGLRKLLKGGSGDRHSAYSVSGKVVLLTELMIRKYFQPEIYRIISGYLLHGLSCSLRQVFKDIPDKHHLDDDICPVSLDIIPLKHHWTEYQNWADF